MEKENLRQIFEAIKTDNEKLFSSFMLSKSDLNIAFGRFPLLSLCYLYKAEKILSKYERFMAPINKFEVVPEYFEIYKTFKKQAKKSLRFFADSEEIVYPILMLGVLDERNLIKQKYKFLYKNEEILLKFKKIYNLNKNIEIIASTTNFEIAAKKFTTKQKIVASVTAVLFLCLSLLSFLSGSIVDIVFGKGTESSPIYVANDYEFKKAIEKGDKYYVLTDDIILTEPVSTKNFTGTIDGKDHLLVLCENQPTSMFKNLSGTVKNLSIDFAVSNLKISSSFAIFAENLTGNIDNCDFSGTISATIDPPEKKSDDDIIDIFVSVVAAVSSGTVSNTKVSLTATATNVGDSNAYISGIVGKNDGTVLNCETTGGKFVADTIDLAGIVAENNGTIDSAINKIELEQTSAKEWNPNCAGIAMTNNGTVKNSTNYAKISAKSTLETLAEGEVHTLAAGISCQNNKTVEGCNNGGLISAEGDIAVGLAAGIVCENLYDVKNSKNTANIFSSSNDTVSIAGGIACRNLIPLDNNQVAKYYPVVESCFAECDLKSVSETGIVYAGGIIGWNNSEVEKCGFEGKIETASNCEDKIAIYAGGVAGLNNECRLVDNYAVVEFVNKATFNKENMKLYGAIAGYVGSAKTYYDYGTGQTEMQIGNGYRYIATNRYVANETIDYVAVGQTATIVFAPSNPFFPTSQTGDFEQLLPDAEGKYYIEYETKEDMMQEVTANE